MGNLGYHVSEGEWIVTEKPVEKPATQQYVFQVAEQSENIESPFDKSLAYLSYYVMVFTAFCAFIPLQTASAMAMAHDLIVPDFLLSPPSHSIKVEKPVQSLSGIVIPGGKIALRGTLDAVSNPALLPN